MTFWWHFLSVYIEIMSINCELWAKYFWNSTTKIAIATNHIYVGIYRFWVNKAILILNDIFIYGRLLQVPGTQFKFFFYCKPFFVNARRTHTVENGIIETFVSKCQCWKLFHYQNKQQHFLIILSSTVVAKRSWETIIKS